MITKTIQPNLAYRQERQAGTFSKFIAWAASLEPKSLPIVAATFMIYGCIIMPLALLSMNLVDGGIFQVAIIATVSFTILVVNLAALPTKITVPTFLFGTLIILMLMISNLVVWL